MYNNMVHTLMEIMPFYAIYGYYPEFTWDVEGDISKGKALATHHQVAEIMAKRKKAG